MVIEESVLIHADRDRVWNTFQDLSRWADWNTGAVRVRSASGRIAAGERFSFYLRLFPVPIKVRLTIAEVAPLERIVWIGAKFGILARHEYVFQQAEGGVQVTSRETFQGLLPRFGGFLAPWNKVRQATVRILLDLKRAAEAAPVRTGAPKPEG